MAGIFENKDNQMSSTAGSSDSVHEKPPSEASWRSDVDVPINAQVEIDLNVTEEDINDARDTADSYTLDEVRAILEKVHLLHQHDPNFPFSVIMRIRDFLENEEIVQNPEKYSRLIDEMKLEAALITVNSPYAEVRAVVDNHDDPNTPCGTIRAWVLGIIFACLLSFVNQMFSVRQPNILIQANVAQFLAYPLAKFCEKILPDVGFTLWGTRHSLNPGKFNKKEHMLITIIANVSWNYPYSNNIIWAQYLPQYYHQKYAGQFGYQILIALATNFIGYGMAGIIRRFLVYPAYCVWPASLVTIALNAALHDEKNVPVKSPFGSTWKMSRTKFFLIAFAAMFVYFWFPNYIFTALSAFSWLSWIAPDNVLLSTITGFNNGLGVNPWPTFDWNILLFDATDPLMIPFFSTFNKFIGAALGCIVVAALYFGNVYSTGYIPINSNRVFDNVGGIFNVSRILDDRGLFNQQKYQDYSPPFLSAGNIAVYMFFFGIYSATASYAYLYHRHEIVMGFRNLYSSMRRNKVEKGGQYQDIHNRLMSQYKEVPEWWYAIVFAVAVGFGCAGIGGWPTSTNPGVVFFGVFLCTVFVIPVGIIKAMTGIEVTLNVLAEFIGGSWVAGNALALNYFKSFGYITCAHAIWFSNDLKLAHYVKIPPRQAFMGQLVGTIISSFVCVGVLNYQMDNIEDVCTINAPTGYTCPGINTFFTASVLWGTLGPQKIFGQGGMYPLMLIGFAIGLVVPLIFYFFQQRYRRKPWLRQIHPIAIFYGALTWSPYNISYIWPAVPIAWYSWVFLKKKYLPFWSKYNFVLSAAFSAAIAMAAIIMFFALQQRGIELEWWGNSVTYQGCEGSYACALYTVKDGEYFGPRKGSYP